MRLALPKLRKKASADQPPPARPGHPLAVMAALVALTVLLGIFAGAHLALSSDDGAEAEPVPPAPEPVELSLLAEEPWETAAAPPLETLDTSDLMASDDAGALALHTVAAATLGQVLPTLVPARRPPQWQRHAVEAAVRPGQPMIAIVIDDLGLRRANTARAIELPGPLTLSLLTYARDLPRLAAKARRQGHELLLHVPMEPESPRQDPGPRVLKAGHSSAELEQRLTWALGRFEGFVGINNHMGSRFTAAPRAMAQVMAALRQRGLLFLDSLTSPSSVGWRSALQAGVPYARRDVFLDHGSREPEAIRARLDTLERIAQRRGYAVGIGHPHEATLSALAAWLPEARRRGFALVPISAIVNRQIEIAQTENGSAG